jgi:hypothetical protein
MDQANVLFILSHEENEILSFTNKMDGTGEHHSELC